MGEIKESVTEDSMAITKEDPVDCLKNEKDTGIDLWIFKVSSLKWTKAQLPLVSYIFDDIKWLDTFWTDVLYASTLRERERVIKTDTQTH